MESNSITQGPINLLDYPKEINANILIHLPIRSLLALMPTCKTFRDLNRSILKAQPNKLELIEAIFSAKYYKTALFAIDFFKHSKNEIFERFLEKFNDNPSVNNLIVLGLLAPDQLGNRSGKTPSTHRFQESSLFMGLKNLHPHQIAHLKLFLNKIDSGCFLTKDQQLQLEQNDLFGHDTLISNALALKLYNIHKILFDCKLSTLGEIGKNTFLALSRPENFSLFLEFIQSIFKNKDYVNHTSREIYELAHKEPFIALCELITNDRLPNFGQVALEDHFHISSKILNQDLIYKIFIRGERTKETFIEYFKLTRSRNCKSNNNLMFLLKALYRKSLEVDDKNTLIFTAGLLLECFPSRYNKDEFLRTIVPLLDKFNFFEVEFLINSCPETNKSDLFYSLIKVCLEYHNNEYFINALYFMRLLNSYSIPLYQECQARVIQYLTLHKDSWHTEGRKLPLDLQSELGNLITYILSKKAEKLEYLNLVDQADFIYGFFDLSQESERLRALYRDIIDKYLMNPSIQPVKTTLPVVKEPTFFNENDFMYDSDQSELESYSSSYNYSSDFSENSDVEIEESQSENDFD